MLTDWAMPIRENMQTPKFQRDCVPSINIYWYLLSMRHCAGTWGYSDQYNREAPAHERAYLLKVCPAPQETVMCQVAWQS